MVSSPVTPAPTQVLPAHLRERWIINPELLKSKKHGSDPLTDNPNSPMMSSHMRPNTINAAMMPTMFPNQYSFA